MKEKEDPKPEVTTEVTVAEPSTARKVTATVISGAVTMLLGAAFSYIAGEAGGWVKTQIQGETPDQN